MNIDSFSPLGSTVNIVAANTTANVALAASTDSRKVRVVNVGLETVFIEFGVGAAIAAVLTTSMPVPAGAICFFDIGGNVNRVAAITASGTSAIYFTEGRGT